MSRPSEGFFRMKNAALFSSKKQDWRTPEWFLNVVREVSPIWLDPCTHPSNPTNAELFRFEGGPEDGLSPWPAANSEAGLVYANPPYSDALEAWSHKFMLEASLGHEIMMLVHSRTETHWYRRIWKSADSVAFWPRRIQFIDTETGKAGVQPPAPSTVFYKQGSATGSRFRFLDVMQRHGCLLAKV